MTVNLISLNSVEAQNVSVFTCPFNSNAVLGEQYGIIEHIGRGLDPDSSHTNPTLSGLDVEVTFSGATIISSLATNLHNLSTAGTAPAWDGPGVELVWEFKNDFEVDVNAVGLTIDTTSTAPTTFLLEGSSNNVDWSRVGSSDSITWAGTDQLLIFEMPNNLGYFRYLRMTFPTWASTFYRLHEVEFYGKLRNLTTGFAGKQITKDAFYSFPEVDIPNTRSNTIVRYDGSNWETVARFPWEVQTLVLSTDLTISSAYKPTHYFISPGGAAREIILPNPPELDDAIKIKNLDGAFALTIKDSPSDPSPVVLSNAGKLQYEFVYDGTDWLVTG